MNRICYSSGTTKLQSSEHLSLVSIKHLPSRTRHAFFQGFVLLFRAQDRLVVSVQSSLIFILHQGK
jgi:hypothetical protein